MAELKFVDLTTDNLFDFCALINAIGADQIFDAFNKDEIVAMTESGEDVESIGIVIGMRIGKVIVKNLSNVRNEFYQFFANCTIWDNGTAVTVEEIRTMKIGQLVKMIKEFSQKEDLVDFFREVAEFLDSVQNDSGKPSTEDTIIPIST